MDFAITVPFKSRIDRNLRKYLNETSGSHHLSFGQFVNSLVMDVKYNSDPGYLGYVLYFRNEQERTLFCLKWG